ncbi:MAG: hypothetical protein AVDCRST_MAG45-2141 [uncultured Solirubrobacterales bacterium]|uniref:Uncharacterized protein n=1 Tax=uncultured Solirubrobacterales bacterium TaxID=768556 RepID=A0A6J4T6U6_9ACTN|nr:MAG: hypothetical protein AVDCRST_MAG45-2141 [uncultured Solirubrobacterales bacterium]
MDYVTVGGFAVVAHGVVRATVDVDLIPAGDTSNLARLASALVALAARPEGEPATPVTKELLARDANVRLQSPAGQNRRSRRRAVRAALSGSASTSDRGRRRRRRGDRRLPQRRDPAQGGHGPRSRPARHRRPAGSGGVEPYSERTYPPEPATSRNAS